MKISQIFGLDRTQAELDFVDIDVSRDLPLFLDPHFLAQRTDPWSIRASHTVRSFFGYFIGLLGQDEEEEARTLFDHLHEPNETCLGLSRGRPDGNGIGEDDAQKIFESLLESRAVKTGILADLEDCRVFVRGVDKDKTSDMTTNIIRGSLITYTQQQCALWGIDLTADSPSGFCWDSSARYWDNFYTENLYVGEQRILLVPKACVSYAKKHTPKQYHQHFVLNFLQHDHLRMRTSLVQRRTRRDGSVRDFVTKKSLQKEGGAAFDKEFLASFTNAHPQVFAEFKQAERTKGASISIEDFGEDVEVISDYLQGRLKSIPAGPDNATNYHRTVTGILDFLFYPHLINPVVEREIHEGRKRLDLTFDNAATDGFFLRLHQVSGITCPFILIECKNYSRDVANPELDQMAGRFGPNRGQFGLVLCRSIQDRGLFLNRCRDTFRDSRGLMLPITDDDLIAALQRRAAGEKAPLDESLSDFYRSVALA